MAELRTVYVGNLKHGIGANEVENFLQELGYRDFVVQMGISGFPMCGAFCFVQFEDLIDANNLRSELLEVSAQIGKCMPHRYSQCENQ